MAACEIQIGNQSTKDAPFVLLYSLLMPTRLYKSMAAQYAISSLHNRRLKISTIDDLNDPFDLLSIDTTDPGVDRAVKPHVRYGLLCFSRNWDNLLMWSHYGASHTGVCLGFDLVDDDGKGHRYDFDVRYQPNVLQLTRPEDITSDLMGRFLHTKHESWSYEQEVRIFMALNDPPDEKGLRLAGFGPELELREVIAGSQCTKMTLDALKSAIEPFGTTVEHSWAYMRKDAFLLVRHSFPPPWFTSEKPADAVPSSPAEQEP
jgi:hypothetical protein